MSAEDQPVLTERHGRVLTITINRPDQRNAVNAAVAQGIAAGLDELDGDPELSVGVLTGAGKGFCAGMDLKAFVTGDPIDAERAYALGLVNRLTEPGGAVSAAQQLAETIAANGPLALAATKRIMVEAADWPDAEFFERQREISDPVFASEDAREGATAFAERRDPVWKGH